MLSALGLLSAGVWSEFADHQRPPRDIGRWLRQADLRQVRGLLIAVLARWLELRGGRGPEE